MKKIIAAILSVVMLSSAFLPAMATEAEELTNVALNRPGFSSWENAGHFADLATDGDASTYFANSYAGWYMTDLGAAYTVDEIRILFGTASVSNLNIYLSTVRLNFISGTAPDGAVLIKAIGETAEDLAENTLIITPTAEQKANRYQYVLVQTTAGGMQINELEAMTSDDVGNPFYMVEVGAFKPVVTATYKLAEGDTIGLHESFLPQNMNDRNSRTAYESTDIIAAEPELKQKVVIDLEAEMPLYSVVYRPTNDNRGGGVGEYQRTRGVKIYASNDPVNVDESNLIFSGNTSYGNNYYVLPEAIYGNSYRYVVVQSEKAESGGAYHHMLTIEEISIYSDNSQTPNYNTTDTGNRTELVSLGASATTTHYISAYSGPNLTDGLLHTSARMGTHGDQMFTVDLGSAKTIDYVAATTGGTGKYVNYNIKVYATNSYNGTAKFDAQTDALIYEGSAEGMKTGVMELYPATADMAGKTYRYICALVPDPNGKEDTSNYPRCDLAALDVYTKEMNLSEEPTVTPAPSASPTPTTSPTASPSTDPTQSPMPESVVNVAKNKAAFSVSSAIGTDPRLALDGDETTSWQSKGAHGLRSELVIDLGTAYPISGFGLMPSADGAANHIKLYGANTNLFTDKAQLAAVTTLQAPATGEMMTQVPATATGTAYRYIIIERPKETTETEFGFAEVAVYTTASVASGETADTVSLISAGKQEYLSNRGKETNNETGLATDSRQKFLDDNPSTVTQLSGSSTNIVRAMVDLGISVPLSHVAYQFVGSSSYGSHFSIVATNNADFVNATYTTLATVDAPVYDADKNTGLLVFSIADTTPYRYVGLVSTYDSGSNIIRLGIGTFQAYAKASDVEDYVSGENANLIISKANTATENSRLSYHAEVLTGTPSSKNAIAFFDRYQNKAVTETTYAESPMSLSGAYNNIELATEATVDSASTWEMAAVNGQYIFDYYTDMVAGVKGKTYTGTTGSSKHYHQVGNTFTLSGTADAGVVGMVILVPGATPADYGKDDIYAHQFIKAPKDSRTPWSYSFNYSMPENVLAGTYTVALLCDQPSSALMDMGYAFTVTDATQLKSDFSGVTATNFMELVSRYSGFFGDLTAKLQSADAAYGTIGASFIKARDAFVAGMFDDNTYNWPEAGVIALSAKAALVVDATLHTTDFDSVVAAHGDVMPCIFGNSDYQPSEFVELLPEVLKVLPTTTAEELVTAYQRTLGLSLIANGTKQEKEKSLQNYSAALGIQSSTLQTSYSLLEIANKLSNRMDTVKNSYILGMDNAVATVIKSLGATEQDAVQVGGGSGGGRGGRGGSGNSSYFPPREIATAPSQTEQNDAAVVDTKTDFFDLEQHGWAKEHIAKLVRLGIISGRSEGVFDPNGVLTREEAVKLLVLVTNADTTMTDNLYLDCEKTAWYYPYISAAKANNLVTGISSEEFGVGRPLTRQDLAVMLTRAMLKLGQVYEGELAHFADDAAIGAYARESVGVLGALGVISGYEDGSFGPGLHASRAEAAVIFSRFLAITEAKEVLAE